MLRDFTPDQISMIELLEASKKAKEMAPTRAAARMFNRNEELVRYIDKRLENATFLGIAYEEALALGSLIGEINRNPKKASTKPETGIEKQSHRWYNPNGLQYRELEEVELTTPNLLTTEPEDIDGFRIAQGYRFKVKAKDEPDYDNASFFRIRQPIARFRPIRRHVISLTLLEVGICAEQNQELVTNRQEFSFFLVNAWPEVVNQDSEGRAYSRFELFEAELPSVDDPDDSKYLDQFKLLNDARLELGDKALAYMVE
jgi:hypothetical protein